YDAAADDRGEEDDPTADSGRDEVASARLRQEHRPAGVHAERPVPLLGRQLEERGRRERAGGAHDDVEPAVARDDLVDELRRRADVGDVRGMRGRGRTEPLDRRRELGSRQVDAGDARARGDESFRTRVTDPTLRTGDEGDAPFQRAHASATIASTST